MTNITLDPSRGPVQGRRAEGGEGHRNNAKAASPRPTPTPSTFPPNSASRTRARSRTDAGPVSCEARDVLILLGEAAHLVRHLALDFPLGSATFLAVELTAAVRSPLHAERLEHFLRCGVLRGVSRAAARASDRAKHTQSHDNRDDRSATMRHAAPAQLKGGGVFPPQRTTPPAAIKLNHCCSREAAKLWSRMSTPTSRLRARPRSVKFAEVMRVVSWSTTMHLACRLAKVLASAERGS